MTKSERLQPIVRISESRERQAAEKLAAAMQRQQLAEARLAELEGYRNEYEKTFHGDARQGVGAEKLRDYRNFVAQLNLAIGQQGKKVSEAVAACEQARCVWLQTRTRTQSLDKVVENHHRVERQGKARREQQDSDERACRWGDEKLADESE